MLLECCLRSQSYEFESNSQLKNSILLIGLVVWDHKVTNLKAIHNAGRGTVYSGTIVWDHKVMNLKAIHNPNTYQKPLLMLFEITKLRIWKQFTTFSWISDISLRCLRSQSYEFESNSQQTIHVSICFLCCLRSQSYEFESNSQRYLVQFLLSYVVWDHKVTNLKAIHNWIFHNLPILPSCLRSQSYEFESNSQPCVQRGSGAIVVWDHKVTSLKAIHNTIKTLFHRSKLFEITKLRIWKQFTTFVNIGYKQQLLFEITKLRIWKQFTTEWTLIYLPPRLFEITKLRIWKQFTTKISLKMM